MTMRRYVGSWIHTPDIPIKALRLDPGQRCCMIRLILEHLVMLEPANALDVIPRIRSMAQKALVDLCVVLAGDSFVHHLEVHHVVAWRRLMALRAVLGSRRGVEEPCNSPTGGLMTVAAFPAEQLAMWLAVAVTACTV